MFLSRKCLISLKNSAKKIKLNDFFQKKGCYVTQIGRMSGDNLANMLVMLALENRFYSLDLLMY